MSSVSNPSSASSQASEAKKMVGGSILRPFFDEDHKAFRDSARRFVEERIAPNEERWIQQKLVDREIFKEAGSNGFMGLGIDEEFGGAGTSDYRFNAILLEEYARCGANAYSLGVGTHLDIAVPYITEFGNQEQKQRWLPGIAAGELIGAIGMTEPGTGSDLQSITTTATRDGDDYIVNGAKTFITNGINADLIVAAVKTDPSLGARGTSMLVIERDTPGFERGRKLEKVGNHGQDTAELFFNDARVPVANRLGEEGSGFGQMMVKLAQERLNIALNAVANCEYSLGLTVDYVRQRKAFGRSIGAFQNTRFKLAELKTEVHVARVFADWALMQHVEGNLTGDQAAMFKYWSTDLLGKVTDECLQLFGGYGYMNEYPIARQWADARVTRIFGGTNEIMKEIIGRKMDLE